MNTHYCIKNSVARYYQPCINRRKAVYLQDNSRPVYARLRNFQYNRTGATDLLPLRDVYCPALERA